MAKCLVLGANGFIGSHLVDALIAAGHTVRAFDRLSDNRVNFNENPNIELINGDFLNRDDLANALTDMEYVFHFISTTTPITAENDPQIDINTNIHMTVELLQEAVDRKIKKVIFASTGGAIYGIDSDRPLKEADLPLPVSPYAIGKLTIEHYLRYFRVKYGLDSVSFRISNPYGERQPLNRKQGVIPIFMEHLYREQALTILGDGTMVRDYVYVKDVAKMICKAFMAEGKHEVYNLGSGQGISINDLIKNIEAITGKVSKKEYKPAPATFVHNVTLDTTLFSEDFGIRPETTLDDGMGATWNYIVTEHKKEQ